METHLNKCEEEQTEIKKKIWMLVTFDPLVSLSLTTARNFLKELNGKIAYKSDLKVNELLFCVLVSFNPL